jgi:hypothetical protein
MHVADLRRVISTGITHVDARAARTWLGLIDSWLSQPLPEDLVPVVDHHDPDRRLAAAFVLAHRIPTG